MEFDFDPRALFRNIVRLSRLSARNTSNGADTGGSDAVSDLFSVNAVNSCEGFVIVDAKMLSQLASNHMRRQGGDCSGVECTLENFSVHILDKYI